MAFAEFGAEAFQEPDLFRREFDLAFGGGLFEAHQASAAGRQAVALPSAADPAGGDLDAPERQVLSDAHQAGAAMGEGMIEDRRLDLGDNPVEMRSLGWRE